MSRSVIQVRNGAALEGGGLQGNERNKEVCIKDSCAMKLSAVRHSAELSHPLEKPDPTDTAGLPLTPIRASLCDLEDQRH